MTFAWLHTTTLGVIERRTTRVTGPAALFAKILARVRQDP
jgi:hypothetical protein